MDIKFNLEYQYQLYLKRINVKESDMHPEQKIQTKQAFYGAVGQILLLLRDDMYELPEDQCVKIMESLLSDVTTYFLKRTQN